MSSKLYREHRRVGNAHISQTIYAQVCVDNATLGEREHGARRRRVVLRSDCLRYPIVPGVVGVDICSGKQLSDQSTRKRLGLRDLSCKLRPRSEQNAICFSRSLSPWLKSGWGGKTYLPYEKDIWGRWWGSRKDYSL